MIQPTFVPLLAWAVDPWILAFALLTVLGTIFMGFWSARKSKTASDFFVAGRSVSVGWNASAISGEYLSAASFMGVAGMVMSSGYDALWYPVCYACGYLFLLLFIAGPLRRFGAYTIPDFAEGRYDSPVFRKMAVVFVLFIGFFYTMPQMKGAGTTLAYIFPGLPYWAGVVLVGAVITLNVALGGMKGITLVQAFQYWAKMFAISLPVFVLMAVYGHYGKQVGANDGLINGTLPSLPFKSVQDIDNAFMRNAMAGAYEPLRSLKANFGLGASNAFQSGATAKTFLSHEAGLNTFPIPLTNTTLENFRIAYSYFSDKAVYFYRNDAENRRFALDSSKFSVASLLARRIEELMRTNGISVISLNQTQALFLTDKELQRVKAVAPGTGLVVDAGKPSTAVLRVTLPEKAPKDDAWLNPFGPLTSKAAKSAAAKLPPGEQKSYLDKHQKPFSLLYTYSLIIALVCGTAGLPHILVRFYTNPDGVAAKRTTMWVMILIGVFYVFPPVFGVLGRNLMPDLYNGLAGVKGTDGIVLKLPTILRERFGILGSILSGVTCAGAFAAFMSTFSGLLVSMTGALAHDVYGRILKPKSSPEARLRAFKISAVLLGGVAILLGTLVENFEINFMVGQAFAIAASSYFPLLFMSIWWRRMTVKGAATGMLSGGLLALAGISLTSYTTFVVTMAAKYTPATMPGWLQALKEHSLETFWAAHPLMRILCEQPAIWAVPLAISLMVLISLLTHRTVPSDIRMKMLVLHAPEKLGLKQEYIQEHQHGH